MDKESVPGDGNVDTSELIVSIQSLQSKCIAILEQCKQWNDKKPIEGLHRYTNSLTSELHFLEKLLNKPEQIKKEYVQSTNLGYLEAVYEALASVGERREEVMRLVSTPSKNDSIWKSRAAMIKESSIKVDIVAEHGLVWIKVIARNAKAFRHEVMGLEWDAASFEEEEDDDTDDEEENSRQAPLLGTATAHFESLPIFKKAQKYLDTAKAHHVQFHTPIVVFAFMRIYPEEDVFVQKIMDHLSEMGVVVYMAPPPTTTTTTTTTTTATHSLRSSYTPLLSHYVDIDHLTTPSINVDVSSALAILSELSHHVCPPEEVSALPLKIQAEREAKRAVLPQILPYIKDKKLFIIRSAYERLKSIVDVVGGPNEKRRFCYLFRNVLQDKAESSFDPELWTCLPSLSIDLLEDASSVFFEKLLDPPPPSAKGQPPASRLNNGRKIRTRFSDFHAKIFGSGHHYKMTTLTAIQWMETALEDAGLQGALLVTHEPRSLAERKMTGRKRHDA
ncbi:hypothetical protein BDF20DRAFT_859503 [Mycotypha africana]|uniref:uncharacterized protein n=1 Tax=Mycotypha africana TaxID=64632 RepID=UPI002300FC3E|nr:uncharacterized protein BDF20DRAFT_859503 [Mycotypha africana]KAI8984354.1 hypothetical protein BDF20DRAFT_859503 [Mycotypha africana]